MQEKEWLYVLELVRKESYPVYGEDFEDTISENYLYCIQRILAERKRPGRRRKITAEFIRQKIANRIRTRKAKYRRERELCLLNLL
jgi:CRISPR/Cas system-associated endonuclease Cas1